MVSLPRRSLRSWRALITAVALASFALGHWLYAWDASFVYYMLPSRAGELLVGALVAMLFRFAKGALRPHDTSSDGSHRCWAAA